MFNVIRWSKRWESDSGFCPGIFFHFCVYVRLQFLFYPACILALIAITCFAELLILFSFLLVASIFLSHYALLSAQAQVVAAGFTCCLLVCACMRMKRTAPIIKYVNIYEILRLHSVHFVTPYTSMRVRACVCVCTQDFGCAIHILSYVMK